MLEIRFQQARDNLKRQIAILSMSVATIEESIAILESELDLISNPDIETESPPSPEISANHPRLDVGTLSVEYQGKRCQLGNNLRFKLLARLLRRPNRYISYDTLFAEVWTAVRDPSSVRSVVKELRAVLRAAGMADLADAIDGHVAYHYAIILNRL
ncbi:MAG: winged helix-turn-helix domain-containing protein [Planctomycetaceae bacterium]|nr:winged helix-turn-helix domain-containing protein [Planctomycetaceae bacterium]